MFSLKKSRRDQDLKDDTSDSQSQSHSKGAHGSSLQGSGEYTFFKYHQGYRLFAPYWKLSKACGRALVEMSLLNLIIGC